MSALWGALALFPLRYALSKTAQSVAWQKKYRAKWLADAWPWAKDVIISCLCRLLPPSKSWYLTLYMMARSWSLTICAFVGQRWRKFEKKTWRASFWCHGLSFTMMDQKSCTPSKEMSRSWETAWMTIYSKRQWLKIIRKTQEARCCPLKFEQCSYSTPNKRPYNF